MTDCRVLPVLVGGSKPHMPIARVDELLLVKYLLGNLSEEEQVRVEDHAFEDRDYLNAIQAAEADLIDAYARDNLPQEQRRAFERRFLVSPQRRAKVEFARALARVTDEAKAGELPASRRISGWKVLLDLIRGWNPALQFATGMAALICVAGVWWLIAQNASTHSRIVAAEAERHQFDVQQQQLRRQLSEERARAESLAAQVQRTPSPAPSAAPSLAMLVLSAGISRAGTRVEELILSPTVQVAHIDVPLEARDDYPRYRIELRTGGGEEILIRSNLVRRRAGAGYTVSFDVPASALDPGQFELAIKGIAAGGSAEEIGYHYFNVLK